MVSLVWGDRASEIAGSQPNNSEYIRAETHVIQDANALKIG